MKIFICLNLFFIWADNIEIRRDEFEWLILGNKFIKNTELPKNSSLKISHLPYSIYFLKEVLPGVFVLCDKTRYFGKPKRAKIRLDVEDKTYLMCSYVYEVIAVLFIVEIFFIFFVKRPLFVFDF